MARHRHGLKRAISSIAAIALLALLRLCPLPLARWLMIRLGRIALRLLPRLHRVGMDNLDLAYGDTISIDEKRAILRGAMDNLAIIAAEFPHLPRLLPNGIRHAVTIEGREHVDFTRGFIAIGGHLGNWEYMAPAIASEGVRMAGIVRPLSSPLLNAIVERLRHSGLARTIDKEHAAREVFRLLKEGWIVGVMVDQCPRDNAVPATFFGKACWATAGAAMLALRSGAPVHPVSMTRNAPGRYTMRCHPALEMVRTGDLRSDLVENSQRCQDAVERMVRAHPEQWLWFHRRWKPRPRLEAEWAARLKRGRKTGAAEPSP